MEQPEMHYGTLDLLILKTLELGTDWGISETNRKVKLYKLTAAGRKQLRVEAAKWEKATAMVARFLETSS